MKRVAFLWLMIACVPPHEAFYAATAPATDGAFQRAMRAIVSAGEAVETSDEKSGIIVTKWQPGPSMLQMVSQTRWTITVANGQVVVDSQCQRADHSDSSVVAHDWQPCSDQPEGRTAKAREIAHAIGQ